MTPRTLLLAGLGAALLARREAGRLAGEAAEVPERLRAGAEAAAHAARLEARRLAKAARDRLAPMQREADRVGVRIGQARAQGLAEAAKRLNPLLSRAGLPTIRSTPKRPARAAGTRAKVASATRRPDAKNAGRTARRRA